MGRGSQYCDDPTRENSVGEALASPSGAFVGNGVQRLRWSLQPAPMIPAATGLDTGRAPASFVSIQASHFPTTRDAPGVRLADAFLRRLRQSSRIVPMEFRRLGSSGFKVPVLSLGTGTFGGKGMLKAWGASDVKEARRLVDICLEAGLNMFDSADVYSSGEAEAVLGGAIKGSAATDLIISTKATFRSGARRQRRGLVALSPDPGGRGRAEAAWEPITSTSSSCTASTRMTPVEEALSTLDDLVRAGKIRYIGCSNFSGWHLMKSLAASDRYGWSRYVAHQAYYSLIGRDYEWELMPLGARPGRRRGGVEPARLGPPDRQDPPRPAAAEGQPAARNRRQRSAGRRRVPLSGGGRPGRGRRRDRQDRPAGGAELAAAAADGVAR